MDLYSKKVMKYFKNPKNIGEIKNADGIGKVGNPVCLLPEEKIHKNSDSVDIFRLKENQMVLTHSGKYEMINATSSRNYEGQIVTLKNKLGKISLTPEHLIFAIKKVKGDKFLRTKNKRKLIPAWHHASQLEKGDVILYPILKEEKEKDYIEINVPKPKWDFKSKEVPNKIPLNQDFLRLCGYFLSEGNIQDKPRKTFISFSLNIREKEIVEDIENISKNLFGFGVKIKELPKRKTSVVFIYSAKLARFFKELFGNGAQYKKIPDLIMSLPAEKQKSLIFGLWKGDGYVNVNRNGARAGFVSISYQLAQQMKTLLLRQSIVPSIYEEKEKIIGGVKHKKSYRIHVGQRDSLKRLCNILNMKYNPKSYESVKSWFDENYLYTSITDKKISNYKGMVYNLEVNNSHSFVSNAFCLHNCGDVMWVYIKVGKNKKGKEILKDIKVKTFGCIAAISTSSILSEMAKGKTLDEALKISKMDIAKELGGLPPIKMHCSVLSAEGLEKAIQEYRKKKGENKK